VQGRQSDCLTYRCTLASAVPKSDQSCLKGVLVGPRQPVEGSHEVFYLDCSLIAAKSYQDFGQNEFPKFDGLMRVQGELKVSCLWRVVPIEMVDPD